MKVVLTLVGLLAVGSSLSASGETPSSVASKAKGASHVVVARVIDVQARFDTSQFGDQLIVSDVQLQVEEELKGSGSSAPVMTIEGGTIGDLTLDVSDMPRMKKGERAVVFLKEKSNGSQVPNGRGSGIMKLDKNNKVEDSDLTLDEVKRQVKEAK